MAGRPPKAGSVRAKARREARAILTGDDAEPPKNAKLVAAGRKGAAVTHGRKIEETPLIHNATMRSMIRRALTQHEEALQLARRELTGAIPEAAQFLRKLVRGEIDGATVDNRVAAAKIVLTSGGMLGEGGKNGRNGLAGSGSVNDMSADELRAFIAAGAQTLAAIEASDAVLVTDEPRTTDPGIMLDDSAS